MDKGAKKHLSTPAGFEPARANTTAVTHGPARIAGRRLNHSAKVSCLERIDYDFIYTKFIYRLDNSFGRLNLRRRDPETSQLQTEL